MGAIIGQSLVEELQRRLTNLSDDDALGALNRACRWINRQASFQFQAQASTVIVVDTPTASTVQFSGTITMTNGDAEGVWASGSTFDDTGTWSALIGYPPQTPTGHDGLTITINGTDFLCYIVEDTTHMVIVPQWTDVSGDYDWSITINSTATANGPVDLDPGKAKLVLNLDGSPVQHVPTSEFWASFNYNVSNAAVYDTYTILTDNTQPTPTHQFVFFPSQPGTVTLYYHKVTPHLATNTYTPFPKEFDDLVVDFAEAEERRIYDIGDWQTLMSRAQDQIKVLIDGYKNMTTQPAMVGESAAKIQEETQLGRA